MESLEKSIDFLSMRMLLAFLVLVEEPVPPLLRSIHLCLVPRDPVVVYDVRNASRVLAVLSKVIFYVPPATGIRAAPVHDGH